MHVSSLVRRCAFAASCIGALLTVSCSLSSDKPLTWKTSLEVPITAAHEFVMGRMIDTLFFGGDQITDTARLDTLYNTSGHIAGIDTVHDTLMQLSGAYGDSTDTVMFSVKRHAEQSSSITEKLFDETDDTEQLGPLPLSQVASIEQLMPLTDGPISTAVPTILHNVYRLHFDTASGPLSVTVANPGGGR